MKKVLFACLIGAASIAPAHAAGPYVGIGVSAFDKTGAENKIKGSLKLFGGYDFNDTWGIEAGLVGLPEYRAFSAMSDGKASGQTLYVAAKATTPIVGKLSLITKLGIAQTRLKFTADMNDFHENRTGLYAGIGLKYALTEKISLTMELERLGRESRNIGAGPRRETLSLNASFAF